MSYTKANLVEAFRQSIGMVTEFHRVYGHPIGVVESENLSEDRAIVRASYLFEELQEGLTAAISLSKVGVVDALADSIYFACGNLVECGVSDEKAMDRLDRMCGDEEDFKSATQSLAGHAEKCGWARYMRNGFVSSLAEASEVYSEGLTYGDEDEEVTDGIRVVPLSLDLPFAYLAMISAIFKADPLAVMQEVHRSNMSKLLPADLADEDACRFFMASNGCQLPTTELKFERLDDGRWIAKNLGTNKVVKNPLYSEANLEPLVP